MGMEMSESAAHAPVLVLTKIRVVRLAVSSAAGLNSMLPLPPCSSCIVIIPAEARSAAAIN